MTALRRLVPRAVRHGISSQLARVQAGQLERRLAALASGSHSIVAGPWVGEVGFELLYWAPFLAWFAERFEVAPERLVVVSRGGTESWYQPFAGGYREIFTSMSPHEFRRQHDQRVAANGEQKQTRLLAFEHDLLRTLAGDIRHRVMLHPATMYDLFKPFWWGHVDEGWVHRRARYRALRPPASAAPAPAPYTAVKFYFNDCFPSTERNRAFVRATLERLLAAGPVVSLTTGLDLDDHGGCDFESLGVQTLPSDLAPADNLRVQAALVAGAEAFVGTYGGFSYLAPFYGVRSTAYYGEPHGFSLRHLTMARSALRTLGREDLLDVQPLTASPRHTP